MKIKFLIPFYLLMLSYSTAGFCQSISAENVDFDVLKKPNFETAESLRTYKVTVTSPYNLTADDVMKQARADFELELKNHDKVVATSEAEYQQKLKNYDSEIETAKKKFALESEEFKKLSMLERLAMTDQGKNPKLVTPNKPNYVKPAVPQYREPNLNDYIIVNNDVLSTQIKINGFSRTGSHVDVLVDIKKLTFQDNAGQTFANQPTKVIVKVNGVEKATTNFFQEFKFVSSSPSNNINKPLTEKNFLNDVLKTVNSYLNENFGYQVNKSSVKLLSVKNKGNKYDDLEKADIYVTTNLRKINPENPEMTKAAMAGLQKGIDIWTNTLAKVDFKDKKSDFNAPIAEFVYFNLIRLNLALGNKTVAEKYLNDMQENMIYMKLNSSDEAELKAIENQIYKSK
ncbi:MAG: hypothetical protein ACI9XR_000086 [Flavobacterium sp.]|jgi:hypothetical protein